MSASSYDSYDDGLVQLDREAITLRRYHFPSGTSKIIALNKLRGYRAEPLGLVLHRFRIWGSSDLRRWLPLDVRRPLRSTLITLMCRAPDRARRSRRPNPTSSPRCWIGCSTSGIRSAPGVGQRLMRGVVSRDECDARPTMTSRTAQV